MALLREGTHFYFHQGQEAKKALVFGPCCVVLVSFSEDAMGEQLSTTHAAPRFKAETRKYARGVREDLPPPPGRSRARALEKEVASWPLRHAAARAGRRTTEGS